MYGDTDKHLLNISTGNILFLDLILPSAPMIDIWYDNSSCISIYNDRLKSNINYVAKILLKCNDNIPTNTLIKSLDANTTKNVSSFSASKLYFYVQQNSTYYPGSSLLFNYKILDTLNNSIDHFNFNYSEININVENSTLNLIASINIDKNGTCPLCNSGITISGANLLRTLYGIYDLELQLGETSLILLNKHIYLQIIACPIGFGSTNNKWQCQQCPPTTYNLIPNNTEECKSCDENINNGIYCESGLVYIESNHWIGINENSLSSSLCPYSYCCQNNDYCKFTNIDGISIQYKNNELCALNRNPNSYLCSKCNQGYSQVFRSAICKKCDDKLFYYLPLVIYFGFGLLYTMLLLLPQMDIVKLKHSNKPLLSDSKDNKFKKCVCCCKKSILGFNKSYFMEMIKVLLFKGILYYQQSLSQILINSNIEPTALSWWISLFNLSIFQINSSNDDGFCFYDGMTAKHSGLFGFFILII
eukprot:358009_1